MKNQLKPLTELSKREEQILELVVLSYTAENIADMLFISLSTVNTHIRNIKIKTGSSKNTDLSLVWFCRTQGITISELLRKRVLPVLICIMLQIASAYSGADMCRTGRARTFRGRRNEIETLII